MPDDNKSPLEEVVEQAIEQALDVFLYAPLGLALVARDQLPALIERGRKQVAQQTTLARMMGQQAAKEADKKVRARVERTAPRQPATQSPPPPTAPAAASPNGAANPAASSEPKTPTPPKPSGDHLAIPGYDTLSASQVVQRLPGLDHNELDAVRAYEEDTRGRRTILTKISQLQADV